MQTTIITCDRCKESAETKEQKDEQQIMRVAVGIWTQRYSSNDAFSAADSTHAAEWCKSCREKMGLFYHRAENPAHATLPTLEDLIREIATEAAQEAVRQ